MKTILARLGTLSLLSLAVHAATPAAHAWDYEGHRLINQLALDTLPANFPAFVKTPAARERIGFLGGEADRWRNTTDLSLKHCNGPDSLLRSGSARRPQPRRRATANLPLRLRGADSQCPRRQRRQPATHRPAKGFRPHACPHRVPAVDHHRVSGEAQIWFSYLKEYESAGTPEEIANARENIIYIMGVMGHFLGDATQPLHNTKHHHGWVGANPNGYATNYSIHSWIDGGYLNQFGVDAGQLRAKLRPATPFSGTNTFAGVMTFLQDQFKQVEPLYDTREGRQALGPPRVVAGRTRLHHQPDSGPARKLSAISGLPRGNKPGLTCSCVRPSPNAKPRMAQKRKIRENFLNHRWTPIGTDWRNPR